MLLARESTGARASAAPGDLGLLVPGRNRQEGLRQPRKLAWGFLVKPMLRGLPVRG
jgi:hypothetical protein